MSVYYYLVCRKSREIINFGEKLHNLPSKYQGPICWIDGNRYLLPHDLVDLLAGNFISWNGEKNVELLSEDELFNLEEDTNFVIVGGDEDGDPPLNKYLPSLEQLFGKIVNEGVLIE